MNFTRSYQTDLVLAGSGAHIGVVNPLFVSSPMLDGYNGQTRLVRSGSPFVEIRTPEQVAEAIVQGIERRQFMIWPGWKARVIFWASRYLSMLGHRIMIRTWRD